MNDTANITNTPIEKGDEQYQAIAGFNTQLEPGSVKTAMAAVGAKSADLWQVPYAQLRPLPNFNMRLDTKAYSDHIDALFASMMQNGFYKDKPITGFVAVDPEDSTKQVIFYIDGYSRMAAAAKARANGAVIDTIPVLMKDRKSDLGDLTVASYNANNKVKPYDTLETALLCLRMRQEPIALQSFQIGERLGLTTAYVETLLTLAKAPKEIRDMVQANKVSASLAIEMIRKKKENAKEVLQNAVKAAEKKAALQPAKVTQTAQAGGVKKEEVVTTTSTSNSPATTPVNTTTVVTTATTPAAKVAAETVKPVRITKAALDTENTLLKEQQRLAPRLFAEVLRMEKAGELKVISPELEKLLFIIDAATPKTEEK